MVFLINKDFSYSEKRAFNILLFEEKGFWHLSHFVWQIIMREGIKSMIDFKNVKISEIYFMITLIYFLFIVTG